MSADTTGLTVVERTGDRGAHRLQRRDEREHRPLGPCEGKKPALKLLQMRWHEQK